MLTSGLRMRATLGLAVLSSSHRSFAAAIATAVTPNATDTAAGVALSDRLRGAFFGALVADALCLGSHYEYDAPKIKQAYGGASISEYMAPGERMGGQTHGVGWGGRNYHPGTAKGDQTDYGEYNILVLEHLAATASNPRPFDVGEFIPAWQERLTSGWKQWICTQTKQTFQQIQQGTPVSQLGGNSNAMSLRYASVFAYYDTEEGAVDAARKTMFTHRERTALLGGEFFARVAYRIVHLRVTPRAAIEEVAVESDTWIQSKVQQALVKVKEATDPENDLSSEEFVDDLGLTSMARLWEVGKSEPIKVGKASPTEGTLPGAIYFIVKYQDDMIRAFQANAMVGGDNASRSIAIGMVLGAYHGADAIPRHLRDGLNQWEQSEKLLATLPLLKAGDEKYGEEL
uniref:ADP-ribosylhydrolase ARH3 n=1 Tax=Odontella aurita TaxID=265563 RepID=A0A7S4HJF8_9STRA|mmetsp:Transcript_10968/g.32476  ORF Transcript_10968/g.32476 Transcript_10968/m.32476 type:complete len:401 (+) Transcript_10968:101-1303(+)